MEHLVLYTKNNCVSCKMTHKLLDTLNVDYTDCYHGNPDETNEINLESSDPKKVAWSQAKIDKLSSKYNVHQMPFIKVVDEKGNMIDSWSGFRPDRIKQFANTAHTN